MIKKTVFSNHAIQIGLTLALVATLIFPMFSYAATYQYVNTSGQLSTTSANSSSEALATTPNLGLHSGVMLVGIGGSDSVASAQYVPNQSTQYGYVNSSGVVTAVTADTSTGAFANSVNISESSGVILINSQQDENLIGDTTTL